MEQIKYAGPRIEDKAALLDAKAERDKWLCSLRDDLPPVNIDAALLQIAEMEAAQTPALPPRTNQDALLEKWRDVDELAKLKASGSYDGACRGYWMPNGGMVWDFDEAVEQWKAWLLSPAEDGK